MIGRYLAVGWVLLCAPCAWADAVGYVKNVSGEAVVITAGDTVKAEVGVPVHIGSVLKTAGKGSMGVTFKDETMMSFGPNTELTVDEYLYAPSEGSLRLVGSLARGSLNYISGVIAKLRPEAVAMNTPSGTIGVRGTHFAALVEEE